MKRILNRLSRGYAAVLPAHLKRGPKAGLLPARELGRRAELFFAEAITPIEMTHRDEIKTNVKLNQMHTKLGRRTVDLAASLFISRPLLPTGLNN